MAKGQPDFGATAPTETIVSISDLGELAARLGSIDTFDRRGNVLWFDDFESGLNKWHLSGYNSGYSVEQTAAYAKNGAFSAKLSTGAQANAKVWIAKDLAIPVFGRMGFECSFSKSFYVKQIKLYLIIHDGTYLWDVVLKWIAADEKWQYLGDDNSYHDLSPLCYIDRNEYLFNTVKFVVDLEAEEYVRLIANDINYVMAGLKYKKTAETANPSVQYFIEITSDSAASAIIYVDDVIVTQNEP